MKPLKESFHLLGDLPDGCSDLMRKIQNEEDIKTWFDKIPSMDLIAQGLTGHD